MGTKIFLGLACILLLSSCHHPSSPAESSPFLLDGYVAELDTVRSNFDTSIYLTSVATTVQLLSPNSVKQTNIQGFYEYDNLTFGDFTVSFNKSDYAPITVFHAQNGNVVSSAPYPQELCNAFLVPNSWLEVTIDSFYPNIDTSIIPSRVGVQMNSRGDTTNYGTFVIDTNIAPYGLYAIMHIHSMRPDKPSLGYVELYISAKPGIDPADTNSYDMIVSNLIPNAKDSTLKFVLPQNIGQWYNANLASGSHVFCKAYAYPFQNPYNSNIVGTKHVYPGLGEYPSNTMTFIIP